MGISKIENIICRFKAPFWVEEDNFLFWITSFRMYKLTSFAVGFSVSVCVHIEFHQHRHPKSLNSFSIVFSFRQIMISSELDNLQWYRLIGSSFLTKSQLFTQSHCAFTISIRSFCGFVNCLNVASFTKTLCKFTLILFYPSAPFKLYGWAVLKKTTSFGWLKIQ